MAFGGLYDRYRQIVYASAVESLGDVDSAESVVQDTFLTLWRKLPEIGAPIADLRSWLLVTADNFSRNAARRAGRRRETVDLARYEQIPADPDTLSTHDLLRRIGDEVRAMTPTDVALFRELVVEGRPYDDVARALGLSLGAVKMRMRRIRSRLRERFREELP